MECVYTRFENKTGNIPTVLRKQITNYQGRLEPSHTEGDLEALLLSLPSLETLLPPLGVASPGLAPL